MAIAPIDLQTMYAQMGHLAKVAADQQNGPHLAHQLQENVRVQQDAEKAKLVKKTADNESKTMVVGKDGRRGGQEPPPEGGGRKKGEDDGGQPPAPPLPEIREPFLGNHVSVEF